MKSIFFALLQREAFMAVYTYIEYQLFRKSFVAELF